MWLVRFFVVFFFSVLGYFMCFLGFFFFHGCGLEYGWVNGEGERNVLFNDALNTFYLRLYGVRHMVKDHSDSVKGNPLPPHRLLID